MLTSDKESSKKLLKKLFENILAEKTPWELTRNISTTVAKECLAVMVITVEEYHIQVQGCLISTLDRMQV